MPPENSYTTDGDRTRLIAENVVRRYFDHYLNEVLPEQLVRVISAHNQDVLAHREQIAQAIKVEGMKLRFWILGLLFMGGIGSGVGITRLIGAFLGGT